MLSDFTSQDPLTSYEFIAALIRPDIDQRCIIKALAKNRDSVSAGDKTHIRIEVEVISGAPGSGGGASR